MLKQFVKDSAIYSTTAILSRGVSLFLLPFYARVLSPAEFGMTDILRLFSRFIYLTIALEIGQGLFRFYPEAQSESEKSDYASTAFWFTTVVYTLFVGVGLLFSQSLAEFILESAEQTLIMNLAIFTIWGFGPYNLILLLLRSRMEAMKFAIINLAMTIATIGFSIFFVLGLGMGITGVFSGGLVGQFVGTIFAIILSRQNLGWVFDREKMMDMLKFSIPLVPSSIGVFIALYIDQIAIKGLMSFEDLGLFGRGYQVAAPVTLIMGAFAGSLTALIYTNYRKPDTPGEIARIFRYFSVMVLIIFAGLSMFAREILHVLTTPEYLDAAKVVPFLALSAILNGLYIFMPGLGITKKTGIIAVINVAQALAGIAFNLILIPVLGIVGASLATAIVAAITFIVNMFMSQKNYYVPHNWKQIGLAALTAIAAVVAGTQLSSFSWEGVIVKVSLIILIVSVCFGLGLIQMGDMQKIWGVIRTRLNKR